MWDQISNNRTEREQRRVREKKESCGESAPSNVCVCVCVRACALLYFCLCEDQSEVWTSSDDSLFV